MLRACLAMLVFLAALFGVYYWWLSKQFDPPGIWIGAGVMALVAGGSLGALINSRVAYREWSLTAAARHQVPWQDGRWTAVAGRIHPVGEPVLAPFSGEPCVLCEYDVASQHRISSASRDPDGNPGSDFAGFLMNPCVVRTNQGEIRLLGFPNLSGFGERTITGYDAVLRAYDFMTTSEFENYSGLKLVSVVSAITDAWRDDDGLVRKNLRLGKTKPADLFPDSLKQYIVSLPAESMQPVSAAEASQELAAEEEDDDDKLNDDLEDDLEDDLNDDDVAEVTSPPAIPLLKEKRVKVGDQVCAIGIYSGEKRGLVPGGLGADRFIKLVRGKIETVEAESRNATFSRLIGGLVGLVLVHAAAYGVMMANRYHPEAVKKRQREAFQALANDNLPVLEKLIARGTSVNDPNSSGETMLSIAREPATVHWLIEHGADINARSESGRTPLMEATRRGWPEVVQVLIDAKADLDLKDNDGRTAIDYARSVGRDDIATLLRNAGAKEAAINVEPNR